MGSSSSGNRSPRSGAPVERKCVRCDGSFSAANSLVKYCPDCRLALKRMAKQCYKRNRRARLASLPPSAPCPYCGKPVRRGETYCARCLEEGFNYLHEMFGSTKAGSQSPKPRKKVAVKPGWRGRPMPGKPTISRGLFSA